MAESTRSYRIPPEPSPIPPRTSVKVDAMPAQGVCGCGILNTERVLQDGSAHWSGETATHSSRAAPPTAEPGDRPGLDVVLAESARRSAPADRNGSADVEDIEALLDASDAADTAAIAVRAGVARLGALGGACIVLADDGETLEMTAAHGYPPEIVEAWRQFPLTMQSPVSDAILTRRPVFTKNVPVETGGRPRTGHPAVACMPLLVDDDTVGVLMFTFDVARHPTRHEQALLRALARITARAVARAIHLRRAQRIDRLQSLMGTLESATTPAEVADAVLNDGIAAVGARAASIAVLDAGRSQLKIVASRGYSEDVAQVGSTLPLEAAVPLAAAARENVEVLLESQEDAAARYPALMSVFEKWGDASLAALPLCINGSTVGSIRFTFDAPRVFDPEERAFMRTLAQLCAGAIDRAFRVRSYDRMIRLQALTAALTRAASPPEVATELMLVAVSALNANAAAVAVASGRTTMRTLATHGIHSELVDRWSAFPLDDSNLPGRIAMAKQPMLLGSRDAARAFDPELAQWLEMLDAHSLVGMPLRRADGEPIGVLALAFAAERTFEDNDLLFAVTIANLCAQAFERADLYAGAKDASRRLGELLGQLDACVVAVDRQLRVQYANAQAERLLGSHVVDGPLPEPWPELSLRELAAALLEPGGESAVVTVCSGDSIYEVTGMPGHEIASLVVRDVTERELHERVEREFVTNAAHELRTPLAAIASALDALELGAKDEAWVRDHFISEIGSEVDRTEQLVHALLVLARAQKEPDWLQPARVELEPLLTSIAGTLEVKPDVRVVCRCEPDAAVLGEEALLAAALANLARNAARHTEHGTITLSCRSEVGGVRTIVVQDTGSGMAATAIEYAFDRFYRAEDEDRDGFGIGLAIVREMVHVLGGTIELTSKPAAGTTVRITLPAA